MTEVHEERMEFGADREQKEAIWRKRAIRLASRASTETTAGDDVRVLVFAIGAERYAVELTSVASVLAPVVSTPVPGAPAAVAGIIAVNGEIRPVLDLRRMLGMEPRGNADVPAPVVLLHRKGRQLGLLADRVEQIRSIRRDACRPTGEGGLPARFVESLTDDTLLLLKPEALFQELLRGEEAAG
ncbi:MAG TPA: chemotaxis protein CheW [Bryobacteraceae bacterium]|jgi:chemotaxis signal transduction protein